MSDNRSPRSSDDLQRDAIEHLDRLQIELNKLKDQVELSRNRAQGHRSVAWTLAAVKALLRARRRREAVFGHDLFADPAWDILLELYAAELAQRRIPTTALCDSAAVPQSTALRWIEKLDRLGWLQRRVDPLNARRIFVELTSKGAAAMDRYFSELELVAGEARSNE